MIIYNIWKILFNWCYVDCIFMSFMKSNTLRNNETSTLHKLLMERIELIIHSSETYHLKYINESNFILVTRTTIKTINKNNPSTNWGHEFHIIRSRHRFFTLILITSTKQNKKSQTVFLFAPIKTDKKYVDTSKLSTP